MTKEIQEWLDRNPGLICKYNDQGDLTSLNCRGGKNLVIPEIPTLQALSISTDNSVKQIPYLENLQVLVCSDCIDLVEISHLPNLITLSCYRCSSLKLIHDMPNLETLTCWNCANLERIPCSMPNLKDLSICDSPNIIDMLDLAQIETLETVWCGQHEYKSVRNYVQQYIKYQQLKGLMPENENEEVLTWGYFGGYDSSLILRQQCSHMHVFSSPENINFPKICGVWIDKNSLSLSHKSSGRFYVEQQEITSIYAKMEPITDSVFLQGSEDSMKLLKI